MEPESEKPVVEEIAPSLAPDKAPEEPTHAPPPKPRPKIRPWVSITAGTLVLLAAVGAAGSAYYQQVANKKEAASPSPTPSSTATASSNEITPSPTATATSSTPGASLDKAVSASLVTEAGVSWIAPPEALPDLGLLSAPKDFGDMVPDSLHYFKVGSDSGKDIVMAEYQYYGPGYDFILYHFLKESGDSYRLLTKHSQERASDNTYAGLSLTAKVTGTSAKAYQALTYQESLTVNGAKLSAKGNYPNLFSIEQNPDTYTSPSTLRRYADTAYGILYVLSLGKQEQGYGIEAFVLRRPNGTSIQYQLYPSFFKDDTVPTITWSNGDTNTDTYRLDGIASCGSPFGVTVINDANMADLAPAGTASTGETIYGFTNPNNAIVQAFYQPFVGTSTFDDAPHSVEDYLKAHSLFVYKDKLNRLALFSGGKYALAAECGKPVVYLYPTTSTQVSVKVGAKISVSEPDYGNGWQVLAQPNGRLTTADGKQYGSLFWEGLGQGQYPAITEGFVVAQADLEKTLRTHLSQLGLNAQESADFLEFWLPKMPSTPYVRLTWFGTRQMDRLAPLTVEPKPQTQIRIFLDFAGLEQSITLPAQHLSAPARKGFTLVEWGGLLRK